MKDVLENTVLFRQLDESAKKCCLSYLRARKVSRGELIVREGEVHAGLILLVKGEAAVQKYTSGGDYSTISLLLPGDCFGEETVVNGKEKCAFTLEAVSDVEFLYITAENLLLLMEKYPRVKDGVMSVLSDRIRIQAMQITILSQKSVRQKIVYYLLMLRQRQGTEKVCLPGSREVVSKLLAMPRQSFTRELMMMEKEGLISITGRNIAFSDPSALKKCIGE